MLVAFWTHKTSKKKIVVWNSKRTEAKKWFWVPYQNSGAFKTRRGRPVDNRPSTDKLHQFVRKKERKKKIFFLTYDTWNETCDMWHVTCDTWHVTRWGEWTFSQTFSCLALTVCDLWYYEDMEEKADSLSDEAVYRTAPATLGLLIKLYPEMSC